MEKNIELEYAIQLIRNHVKPVERIIKVSLDEALNYRLAHDFIAPISNPPFDRSPLDGYALRSEDSGQGKSLKIVDCIYAGDTSSKVIGKNEAVRIMTGAPIPQGCDCVIRLEDCTWNEHEVIISKALKHYENYCFKGEDIEAGTCLVKAGEVLSPVHLGILASMGCSHVEVFDKIRVGLLISGSEIIQPDSELTAGKIYDTNLTLLKSSLTKLGFKPTIADFVDDDAQLVCEKIKAMLPKCDCIITTGGVSVGDKDIFHDVVKLLEAEQVFWRVKMKPGTPAMFSIVQGCPLLSLSGNPFAALATFDLMGRELLASLSLNDQLIPKRIKAVLKQSFEKCSPNRRFIRGYTQAGIVEIKSDKHASGMLASMLSCNCLIDIEAGNMGLIENEEVNVVMLEGSYE